MPSREELIRAAIRASLVSAAFAAVVGVGALLVGLATRSLSLIGFALDTMVDLMSSLLLAHRFRAETVNGAYAAGLEQRALRVISWLLVLAGLYVGVQAVLALVSAALPEKTAAGIVIATASVLVLPGLAFWKRRLSQLIGSRALRADSLLTAVAAILAAITLASVLVDRLLSSGRADAVAALLIALVLIVEGVRGARLSP